MTLADELREAIERTPMTTARQSFAHAIHDQDLRAMTVWGVAVLAHGDEAKAEMLRRLLVAREDEA